MENSDNRDVLIQIADTLERIDIRLEEEQSGNLYHQIKELNVSLKELTDEVHAIRRTLR